MTLSTCDVNDLKKIIELYNKVKSLYIYSEEADPSFKSNLQVIKEFRDALDHIVRVLHERILNESKKPNSDQYCHTNLDKAIGHLYRAGFDALDGTVLSLRMKSSNILENYPIEIIKSVIPDYATYRIKLEQFSTKACAHRTDKDIGGDIYETFNQYINDIEELKEVYKKVIEAVPVLDEYLDNHKKTEQENRKRTNKDNIITGVIYSIISAIIVAFIFRIWPINQPLEKNLPVNSHESQTSPVEIKDTPQKAEERIEP